jgi:hypothetical protein
VLLKAAMNAATENDWSWPSLVMFLVSIKFDVYKLTKDEWMKPFDRYRQLTDYVRAQGCCPQPSPPVSEHDSGFYEKVFPYQPFFLVSKSSSADTLLLERSKTRRETQSEILWEAQSNRNRRPSRNDPRTSRRPRVGSYPLFRLHRRKLYIGNFL